MGQILFLGFSLNTYLKRGSPSLVGSRPAKSVVHRATRVRIPHPAPLTEPRDFHQEIYETIQGMKDDQLAELTIFHTAKKLKMRVNNIS